MQFFIIRARKSLFHAPMSRTKSVFEFNTLKKEATLTRGLLPSFNQLIVYQLIALYYGTYLLFKYYLLDCAVGVAHNIDAWHAVV